MVNPSFTQAQINEFIKQSPRNHISFMVTRNPSAYRKYIQQHYPTQANPVLGILNINQPSNDDMVNLLMTKFDELPENQRAHFMATLMASMPSGAEVTNWTTPIN